LRNNAFARNWIKHIDIPDTVTSIGTLAFQNCSLKTVSLGAGLTSIGDYAFENNELTVLSLPENANTVGEGAFYGNELLSIEIGVHVTVKNESSLGTHGDSFRTYYAAKGSRAGIYLYTSGAWKGRYSQ
jgi:hypothetical protein